MRPVSVSGWTVSKIFAWQPWYKWLGLGNWIYFGNCIVHNLWNNDDACKLLNLHQVHREKHLHYISVGTACGLPSQYMCMSRARIMLTAIVVWWFQPVDGNYDSPNTGLTPLLDRKTGGPRCRFSLIVVSVCLCGAVVCDVHASWLDGC